MSASPGSDIAGAAGSHPCRVSWHDRVPYADGLALQETARDRCRAGVVPSDSLILLEHPHVLTMGKRGTLTHLLAGREDLRSRGVELHLIGRGGDITYHGPGQLVGYPIVDLRAAGLGARRYIELLEETLIRTLSGFGIAGVRIPARTGIWVGAEKVAAIGVQISRGVTGHGFALNVRTDLSYFNLIVPCGIADAGVTSMARQLGRDLGPDEVIPSLVDTFGEVFGRRMIWVDAETVATGGAAPPA